MISRIKTVIFVTSTNISINGEFLIKKYCMLIISKKKKNPKKTRCWLKIFTQLIIIFVIKWLER